MPCQQQAPGDCALTIVIYILAFTLGYWLGGF